MNRIAAEAVILAGYLVRTAAIMLIAFGGTCACFMATSSPGDEFRPNDGWQQVALCLPIGFALWFAGGWLIRRGRRPGPPRETP